MDCRLARTHLDAHADDELEPSALLELDAHLESCSECRDELAVRHALKNGVREAMAGVRAPASLRRRIERGLDAEDAGRPGATKYDRVAALAVAALVMLGLGGGLRSDGREARQVQAGIDVGAFDVLRDIVERHNSPLPAEAGTEQPDRARTWFKNNGMQLGPVELSGPEVQYLGARVSHIGYQPAAKLYYSVGGHRVTLVAFRAPPNAQGLITPSTPRVRVGNRQVAYHDVHGYTVPVFQRGGITYAFTGDLDRDRMLKLVANARLP